jgi:hypothetical protein
MTPEIAQAAIKFLERVELKGIEVPAWVAVRNALDEIVKGAQP